MRNCNCSNTIRQNKDEIINRAKKYAEIFKVNVQVHTWTQRGFGRLWDFEEEGTVDRGIGIVEIIKFRDDKSKRVLSDSEPTNPVKEVAKSTGGLEKSDEPVRKGKRKRPTKKVVGDS